MGLNPVGATLGMVSKGLEEMIFYDVGRVLSTELSLCRFGSPILLEGILFFCKSRKGHHMRLSC